MPEDKLKLEEIKEALSKDIEKEGYHLYDLTYQKKDKILTCLLDESLDLDTIEILSEKISSFMDKYDEDFDEYLLDVSSVGIERPIRNEEELLKAVGSYIFVKTKEDRLNGTLLAYEDGMLKIEYQDKNRKKTKEIAYKAIRQLRYAVRF